MNNSTLPSSLKASSLAAFLLVCGAAQHANAQVGVGTTTPNAQAALDITATDKGLLIPRLTAAQRTAIASPPDGLMVFQTDGTTGFWYSFGGVWTNIPNASTAGDNLGNHTATQNLNLAANKLVGNGGSSGLYITNAGNVGLGTTTPLTKLDIFGGDNSNATLGFNALSFQYAGGTGAGGFRHFLRSRHNSGLTFGNALDFYLNNSNSNNTSTAPGTGNIQALTLENSSGAPRVGIGTTAPAATLHVSGSTSTVRLEGLAGTGTRVVSADASGNLSTVTTASLGDNLGNHTATQNLNLGTNLLTGGGSSGLSVDGNGSVGIGTATPTAKLEVVDGMALDTHNGFDGTFASSGSALRFGGPGSGEYLGSKRTAGGNLYGLDFFTNYAPRLSLSNNGNVGIGTTAPAATLHVAGSTSTVRLEGLAGTGTRVVSADASGNLSTVTTASLADNLGNHTATQDLNLGANALTGSGASIGSVGVGVRADGGLNLGQNTTGNNISLGYQSGQGISSGNNNFFAGYQAGAATNTGSGNVFVGRQAGKANTTGTWNTFLGQEAGLVNTTGNYNTFLGEKSGTTNATGSENLFVGHIAGRMNTSGIENVFLGLGAGSENTTGQQNVFIGYASGLNNIIGSRNWSLGSRSGPTIDGLSNAGAIGYAAQVSQSNSLVLGGTGGNAVNVGIGTTAPAATLHVAGGSSTVRLEGLAGTGTRVVSADASGNLSTVTTASLADNLGNHTATQNLNLAANILVGNGGSQGLTITNTGQVGLGVSAPGGNAQLANTTLNTIGADGNGGNSSAGIGSLNWVMNTNGFVGQFYNGSTLSNSNGVAIKVNGANDAASVLDVSKGSQTATGTSLLMVKASGNVGINAVSPSSMLQVNGAVAVPYTTTGSATSFTLTNAHQTLRRFGSCASITIPQPSTCPGRLYTIINSNGTGSNVTLTVSTSGGIYDDVTNTAITALAPNNRITIQSDGTDWIVVGR